MRFSQRIGKNTVRQSLQIEFIDTTLENRLWNHFLNNFIDKLDSYSTDEATSFKELVSKIIWTEFFEFKVDEIPSNYDSSVNVSGVIKYIKNWFIMAEWFEKYDFIEFISLLNTKTIKSEFTKRCNETLKRELAGYRILDDKIVQITTEEEIQTIEEALSSTSPMKPVETHLKTSLDFFLNRKNPDFRNSVKESISAVESFCKIIINDDKATLGKALNQIGQSDKIHGALKNAFSSLYGFTNDAGGIRHALLKDDVKVEMEDAKFMLVSCSAFINYLKDKMIKESW